MFLSRKAVAFFVVTGGAVILLVGFAHPLLTEASRLFLYVKRLQSHYNRELITLLGDLRHGGHPTTWWLLIALGFVYGVVHALGPGHGKTLIATFVLTQKGSYKSALGIAIGGGLCQGFSAVFWVVCTVGALQWLVRDVVDRVQWAAGLSFILTMAIGVFLMIRSGRRLRRHDAVAACGCGRQMGKIAARPDRKAHLLAIAAIGVRPCSGSILILAVAALWHLWLVGIAMTLALSCGTVVTVTTLALLSVFGRDRLAADLSGKSRLLQDGAQIVAFVGGILLILFGGALLVTQFGHPAALMPI